MTDDDNDDVGAGRGLLALLKIIGFLVKAFQSPVSKLVSKVLARR